MKKTILFMGCLALLAAGCNKVETVELPEEATSVESPRHLIVDFQVNQGGATRSIKNSWEEGDVIYVFFDHFFLDYLTDPEIGLNKFSSDVQYMTLTYNGYSWQSAFADEALEKYLLGQDSGSLVAVYYSNHVPQFRCIHGTQRPPEQFYVEVKNCSSQHGIYLFDEECPYTVQNGKLTATLNMYPHGKSVYFFVPGITRDPQSYNRYVFQCDKFGADILGSLQSSNPNDEGFGAPVMKLYTSTANDIVYAEYHEDGAAFAASFANINYPGAELEYVIKIIDQKGTPQNTDDVCYTLTKTTTINGKDAIELPPLSDPRWVMSFVNPVTHKGFDNHHEWVMMADGLRWSTMNVGAADQNEPGDFLNWHEAKDGAEAWGENWKMPTKEQWEGLLNNSSHEITPVYETVDGQQVFTGLQIQALNDGDCGFYVTGNKLFLPADGYKLKSNQYFIDRDKPNGYYWTFTSFWEGSDPRANYVSLTPNTPYSSTNESFSVSTSYLLARPVYSI